MADPMDIMNMLSRAIDRDKASAQTPTPVSITPLDPRDSGVTEEPPWGRDENRAATRAMIEAYEFPADVVHEVTEITRVIGFEVKVALTSSNDHLTLTVPVNPDHLSTTVPPDMFRMALEHAIKRLHDLAEGEGV